MAYDDDRRHLHDSLETALGTRATETLMTYLPPVPWSEFATRAQLEDVRLELDGVRLELKGEIAELRGEMRQGFGELKGEFGELKGQFGELKGEVGILAGRVDAMTSRILLGQVASAGTLFALLLAADRLF